MATAEIGVSLAWMLVPVLELDTSPDGRMRARECEALISEAAHSLESAEKLGHLARAVAESPEFDLEDPELAVSLRADVLAVLEYALQAATECEGSELKWILSTTADSLGFLEKAGADFKSLDVDRALLEYIRERQHTVEDSVSTRHAADLQGRLKNARRRIHAEVAGLSGQQSATT